MTQPTLPHRLPIRLALTALLLALLAGLRVPLALAASITVNTADDENVANATCSLREAIIAANTDAAYNGCAAGSGADTITFAGDYTITLTSTLPALNSDMTIDGAGKTITVSGDDLYRVFIVNSGRIVTLDTLTIAHGYASEGGGVYNTSNALTLANVTFSANSASSNIATTSGGGMYNNNSNPTLTNVTFSANSADFGGGMYNNNSNPRLTNVTFISNAAFREGGGMYNNSSNPTLTNTTFSANSAGNYGGGMSNVSNSNPTLTNTTFSANSASYGGGVYNEESSPTLTNATFSGNSATEGGGMYNTISSSSPALVNVVIANSVGGDCVNFDAGLNASSSNNLIEDTGAACGLTNGVNGNIIGVDPMLGALADNGGFTQTHALLNGSKAINAGTNTGCPTEDQRGATRDSICDIGAFESTVQSGADLIVNTAEDSDDSSCDFYFNGGAYDCTLREAINAANSLAGADTITFAGNYTITLASALPPLTSTLTLDGSGRSVTVSGNNAVRVFTIQARAVVTMSQLSIISGTATNGGGILNDNGTLTVSNSTFSGNSASSRGGGIYSSSGALTVSHSIFSGNSASYGGGISNEGTLTVSHSAFNGNRAAAGGGISNDQGTLTINNSTFSANLAQAGGGISNDQGTLTVSNSTFSNNSVRYYSAGPTTGAGGIDNVFGTATVSHSTFSGNSAQAPGGGIRNDQGTLTVSYSTFSDNFAQVGGGIVNVFGTATVSHSAFSGNSAQAPDGSIANFGGGIANALSTLTVTNSTFSSNSATDYGGGIASDDALTVINSTFSGNSATTGGGIYNSATDYGSGLVSDGMLTVINSTLSGNSATIGGGIYNFGTLDLRNNLIAHSSSGGDCQNDDTLATNINNLIEDNTCSPAMSGDPLLGPLGDYGGSTPTFALLPGSPAIDAAGDCTPFLDPDEDQRGVARPLDGDGDGSPACDIGAVEAASPPDLEVGGNGLLIANGDTTPTISDGTDWGTVTVGGAMTHTFVISNRGSSDLLLNGSPLVTISGASAFSLVIAPATPIGGGDSTTFQVRFAPTTIGLVTATLAIASNDPDETPYTFAIQGAGASALTSLYLPLVIKNLANAPDLVVESLTATGSQVSLTLRNQGDVPVTDAFWVDVYLNPTTAPTGVNQRWQDLGSQGLVWGVQGAALPLDPGESLTLTVGDSYYWPDLSNFTAPLPSGSSVYAQADSVNALTTYGGVLETHEISGGAYNNINGPLASLAGGSTPSAAGSSPVSAASSGLPPRE